MLLSLELPKHLGAAIALEAAKRGQTPARYVEDRLTDAFGLSIHPAASRCPILPADEHNDPDTDD